MRDAQKNLQDAIFVPIQDIIGLIAEDPTYPDKNSGYMLHWYGTSNKGLTQAVNRNVRNLTEEKLKKSLERYLTYANRDNSQWEKFVYDENAIDRNEDLFQGVANKYRIDPKQLKGRTKENLIHNDIVNQIKGLGEEINLPNANINLRQAAHTELQIQVLWNMYRDPQYKGARNSIIEALLPKALTKGKKEGDTICSLFEACDACRKTEWLNNNNYKSIFMFKVLDGQWINPEANPHHLTLNNLTPNGMMDQNTLEQTYKDIKQKKNAIEWMGIIRDVLQTANQKEENKKKKSNQRRK